MTTSDKWLDAASQINPIFSPGLKKSHDFTVKSSDFFEIEQIG
jgi:hypothetical protein